MMTRRLAYAAGLIASQALPVPVIVVGNLTAGGTGKTPLIIWLTGYFTTKGYRPGIVSRGYGGSARQWPQQVRPDSDPAVVGDEPVLIAQRTRRPVAISPNRLEAARALLQHTDCDIILCDDGLQHLALSRDIEIVVIDGERQFGNGRCLPAGPLREPRGRLRSVDMVVSNGHEGKGQYLMEYSPLPLTSLAEGQQVTAGLEQLAGKKVHAVAGIGNPNRFFSQLRHAGIDIVRHVFPDHHAFQPQDLVFDDELPVVMTEKDAVKCRKFATRNMWYLPVAAEMSNAFEHRLSSLMKNIEDG